MKKIRVAQIGILHEHAHGKMDTLRRLTELFEVVATDRQRQKDYFGAPYPFRRIGTKDGQKILNGYSDHFPILIRLKWRPRP